MAALLAFVVAAAAIAALMFGLSFLIALSQDQWIARLRAEARQVKIWGGRILILVGVWLIALAIWADAFARFLP